MIILLPDQALGLPNVLLKMFSHGEISRFRAFLNPERYQMTPVTLSLPKFTLSNGSINLNDLLKAMGLGNVFDPERANLFKATRHPNVCLSSVLHKAVLQVRFVCIQKMFKSLS